MNQFNFFFTKNIKKIYEKSSKRIIFIVQYVSTCFFFYQIFDTLAFNYCDRNTLLI